MLTELAEEFVQIGAHFFRTGKVNRRALAHLPSFLLDCLPHVAHAHELRRDRDGLNSVDHENGADVVLAACAFFV